MKIFADSSFLIALYNTSDQYYREARSILKAIETENPKILISDYIYDETSTFLLTTHKYYGYKRAQFFDTDVVKNKFCDLIFITDTLFHKAREMFRKFNKDKVWSFTDCTSFTLMEDFGINRALTFDQNFSQKGFKILSSDKN